MFDGEKKNEIKMSRIYWNIPRANFFEILKIINDEDNRKI